MHTRRTAQLSSLVLPHPPLPKRASSIRSSTDSFSSPRTPRSSIGLPSPTLFKLDAGDPRRSTDSWSSSVCDGGDDDMEWEWTVEQLSLLSKALDALPSHLLSPFDGCFPPANVLDKISRSIIHAKDPLEWPHSVRATRIKLLNLARGRAEENGARAGRHYPDLHPDILQPTTNVPKRLYRQSSMDFIKGNTIKSEKSIDRLSTRLQRVDRIIPNPAYAYVPNSSRSPSSPPSVPRPNNLAEPPCTPMSPMDEGVLRGPPLSLSSGRGSRLRRSTTTLSGLPTITSGVASNCICTEPPSLRRAPKVKRSESFSSPNMFGLGHSLKRAPSFGSVSMRSIDSSRMSVDDQKENSPQLLGTGCDLDIYPSSDEEEKVRSKRVKKQRKISSQATSDLPMKTSSVAKTTSSATLKSDSTTTPKGSIRSRKTSSKKITRSSSIFGAELPNPQPEPTPPAPSIALHFPDLPFELPIENMEVSPVTPNKRLRRVKTTNFPQRMRRRISFGHLSAPVETETENHAGSGLGSAFQMQ